MLDAKYRLAGEVVLTIVKHRANPGFQTHVDVFRERWPLAGIAVVEHLDAHAGPHELLDSVVKERLVKIFRLNRGAHSTLSSFAVKRLF